MPLFVDIYCVVNGQLVGANSEAKSGRPAKREEFGNSKRKLDTEWEIERTCFGTVQKNKDGDVLIPGEIYEDMEVHINALSESMYTNAI